MVCMRGRYVGVDPRNKIYGQGRVGWLDGIGYRRRVKARIVRSRPLLDPDLNKSTTASQPPSSAAADSSSSKAAATVLDLRPANLVKCSTSTAAAAKIQPVKKKKKKKLPRFEAIIKLLRLGVKYKKIKTT